MSSPTPHELTVESVSMYTLGLLLIAGRIYSRRIVLGHMKNLQAEDWLMLFNACTYTLLMAGINVSGRTATNLLLPGELETLTPEDITERIYGSKIVILLEQSMLLLTWGIKGCMILMYHRLTSRLNHQYVIKAIAVYIILGLIGTELAWFFSCRPFNGYWALPVPHDQCATYQHYSITQAVFNISSDLMMLAVGIPLLLKARVPMKKKIILVGIFGCGVFVILAACLNKYYNFSNPYTTIYMLWYIRESSTAVYVSNLPMLWPLFQRVFELGTFAESNKSGASSNQYHSGSQQLGTMPRRKSMLTSSFGGSEERIHKGEVQLEIEQRVSFTVEDRAMSTGGVEYDLEALGRVDTGSQGVGSKTVISAPAFAHAR